MANDAAAHRVGASGGTAVDGDAAESAAQLDVVAMHEARRRHLIGIACAAGIAVLVPSIAIRSVLTRGMGPILWIGIGMCVALGVAARLRTRATGTASTILLTVIALGYPMLAMQAGGFDAPVLLAIPMVPVLILPFAGARRALTFTAALVVGGVAVWLAERSGLVAPTMLTATGTRVMRAAIALASALAGTWMATSTERERQRLEARLVAQTRTLYEASVRDPLTLLYNRRHLAERLAQELAFAVRHGTPLSVVLLDIDHFKRINDDLGHAGGDEVLVAVSGRLSASVRREDIVARHGGEEFAILLRGLDIEGARTVAERMRVAVDRSAFKVGDHVRRVAISAGCASLACCGAPTVDALLAAADSRLYAAKRAGRNRVVSRG